MQINYVLYILIGLSIISSCSKKSLKPAEYINWVENTDNGLHKEKQIGDLIFDIQFRPADYILCKAGELDDVVSNELLDSLRHQYDSTLFFSITLKDVTGNDPLVQQGGNNGDIDAILYYFQYRFQQDIYIELAETDEHISPNIFHFERFYTINNSKNFMIAFDKKYFTSTEDIKLIIDSKYLSSGMIQFTFTKKQLEEQPHIEL